VAIILNRLDYANGRSVALTPQVVNTCGVNAEFIAPTILDFRSN
jgi:hypothetical protein